MNDPVSNGNYSLLGSILLTFISWLTPENVDVIVKIITAIGAIISSVLAARYYWYAAKHFKKTENKSRNEDKK